MNIYVKSDTEWLYPDDDLYTSEVNRTVALYTAIGSDTGFQLLLTNLSGSVKLKSEGAINSKINILRDVLVNYNSTAEEAGFGDDRFVYRNVPEKLPANCTRKAPFRVYDAFKPYEGEQPEDGRMAFYIYFDINYSLRGGDYRITLSAEDSKEVKNIDVLIKVYDVEVPREKNFALTNWFCIKNMARFHNVPLFGDEHFAFIEKYADAMLRMRQTHFWITTEYVKTEQTADGYIFDLTLVEKLARLFFEKGFDVMEFGQLGMRKRVYLEELNVLNFSDITVDSAEGKAILEGFLSEWKRIVVKNGWEDKIIYHLADEPDEPETLIPSRKKQYAVLRNLLNKYFPDSKVCEAVKTAQFSEYIDIMVPLSETYDKRKAEFDRINSQRNNLWFYVCCVPNVNYCQRFLDTPLISGQAMFWAAAGASMTGFLHWGLNLMEEDQHPFEMTNQFHTYGDGVCLPAGDSHIVYPDGDKLYYSMRLEACRRGVEDLEMLNVLKAADKTAFDALTQTIAPSFKFTTDEEQFGAAHIKLLSALENI
ncbi:MAG: DUF4091 domain-containing protein [Acutalibacteraceae bacterium]